MQPPQRLGPRHLGDALDVLLVHSADTQHTRLKQLVACISNVQAQGASASTKYFMAKSSMPLVVKIALTPASKIF